MDQGDKTGAGHMDPDDDHDESVLLDVLGQSQKVLDRQHRSRRRPRERHDHPQRGGGDERTRQDAQRGVRPGPEDLSARRCTGGAVLVHDRSAADLVRTGTVHRADRLHRYGQTAMEGRKEHRTIVHVGHGTSRDALCALPGVGEKRSILLDLPGSCRAVDELPDLSDHENQVEDEERGFGLGALTARAMGSHVGHHMRFHQNPCTVLVQGFCILLESILQSWISRQPAYFILC